MPINQIHWRIAYPDGHVYHVIASSDIMDCEWIRQKLNSDDCIRFIKTGEKLSRMSWFKRIFSIKEPNGLATIFDEGSVDGAGKLKHVFVEGGDYLDAMNKMVELLDKKHAPLTHNTPIIKI